MTAVRSFAAVICATLVLASCGGKSKKEGDKPADQTSQNDKNDGGADSKLDGVWEIKRAEGMLADANVGTTYSFSGDNLSLGLSGFENKGKTEITDSSFTFQANGSDLKMMYGYEFNGDTLVVKVKDGNQVFYMVKK